MNFLFKKHVTSSGDTDTFFRLSFLIKMNIVTKLNSCQCGQKLFDKTQWKLVLGTFLTAVGSRGWLPWESLLWYVGWHPLKVPMSIRHTPESLLSWEMLLQRRMWTMMLRGNYALSHIPNLISGKWKLYLLQAILKQVIFLNNIKLICFICTVIVFTGASVGYSLKHTASWNISWRLNKMWKFLLLSKT